VAFGLLPVLNAATTSRHLLQSVPDADWVMAGFDLASLAIGAAFAGLAWKVKRHQARRTLC